VIKDLCCCKMRDQIPVAHEVSLYLARSQRLPRDYSHETFYLDAVWNVSVDGMPHKERYSMNGFAQIAT